MQLWLREAVGVFRRPAQFFEENAPQSVPKAVLFLLVSGMLVSLTHHAFRTGSVGAAWWMESAYIAGPVLILGTAVMSGLLHSWMYIDRLLGEKKILFDKLPLDYEGTFADTFIVCAYASAIPALFLWLPLLLAPSIPALAVTLIIGAYTGYTAAYGFALYHDIDAVTEDHDLLLSAEVLGGGITLFIPVLIVLVRPSLVLQYLF